MLFIHSEFPRAAAAAACPRARLIRTTLADAYTDLLLGATGEEGGGGRKGRGSGKKGSLGRAGEFVLDGDDEEDGLEVWNPRERATHGGGLDALYFEEIYTNVAPSSIRPA